MAADDAAPAVDESWADQVRGLASWLRDGADTLESIATKIDTHGLGCDTGCGDPACMLDRASGMLFDVSITSHRNAHVIAGWREVHRTAIVRLN